MTTPAVNLNQTFTGPIRLDKTWFQNNVQTAHTITNGTSTTGRRTKVRPASSSVPLQPDGWRGCKPWSHSGTDWKVVQNPTMRVATSGAVRVVEIYEGAGSFWKFTFPGVPTLPNTNMKNRAEVKALNNLKDQQVHLGQFFAESGRTLDLVASSLMDIRRQVLRFKRRWPLLWKKVKKYQKGRTPKKDWSKIPRRWLELQYGWRPLMSDIIGAMEHLEKMDRGPLIHADGKAVDIGERTVALGSGLLGVTCYALIKYRSTAYVDLWYEAQLPDLAEVSSLGLLNPVEICWELLPYSFVIDWFLPIGSWLSALTGDVGFSFKGGSYSAITREIGAGSSHTSSFPSSHGVITGGRGHLVGEGFNFTRSCYGSSPVPGLYVKNPLSLEHVLNGSALLAQAFR